jgi:hypothetical protein
MSNVSQKGLLQSSPLTYTHPHVLIFDELGYLTYCDNAERPNRGNISTPSGSVVDALLRPKGVLDDGFQRAPR